MAVSASASRPLLLEMPQEIKDHIMHHVLGGKVIHLVRSVKKRNESKTSSHTTCELSSPFNTDGPWRTRKRRHQLLHTKGPSGWCHESCSKMPHKRWGSFRLRLSVLLVCKDFYNTGTRVLYRDNVFSFPTDFERSPLILPNFIRLLQPSQLMLLRRVCLAMHSTAKQRKPSLIEHIAMEENEYLQTNRDVLLLTSLSGLKELSFEFFYLNCAPSFLTGPMWSLATALN